MLRKRFWIKYIPFLTLYFYVHVDSLLLMFSVLILSAWNGIVCQHWHVSVDWWSILSKRQGWKLCRCGQPSVGPPLSCFVVKTCIMIQNCLLIESKYLIVWRTALLTSKRCILYIYSTNIGTEYFKHALYSPFFSLQNAVCFVMLTCLVPVLFTFYIQNVLKLKKIIPAPKG